MVANLKLIAGGFNVQGKALYPLFNNGLTQEIVLTSPKMLTGQ